MELLPLHEVTEEVFKDLDPAPTSIFEVGMGQGRLLLPYVQRHPEVIKVGGIEMDRRTSEEGFREWCPNGEFILADARITPWPVASKSYDAVVSIGTFTMMCDYEPALKEMFRVAKYHVILAEFQVDEEQSQYSGPESLRESSKTFDLAIYWRWKRNYIKTLQDMGYKPTVTSCYDKQVIKIRL